MNKPTFVVLGAMVGAIIAATSGAADAPTPEVAVVDAMQALFGNHPGMRANHAKGVVMDATFVPTPVAAALSKAALFAGPAKAVVRFSNPTGVPDIADNDANANPKGMAAQFTDKAGDVTSMALLSAPVFPGRHRRRFPRFFPGDSGDQTRRGQADAARTFHRRASLGGRVRPGDARNPCEFRHATLFWPQRLQADRHGRRGDQRALPLRAGSRREPPERRRTQGKKPDVPVSTRSARAPRRAA